MKPSCLLLPAALAGLAAPVYAAAEEDLSQVIVTATRTEQSLESSIAAVTVYTRPMLEDLQARSFEDLLRGAAGMSVANSGGPGKLTSFFVRGTESDHLLVLVDGVRIGSATSGAAALQNLPLEMVERVEYVRGPRSSLYGPEAIGGVVQLFTRRGEQAPTAHVGGGSFDTRQVDASWGLGSERAWLNLSGSLQDTAGWNACTGSSTEFAGCFTEEPDEDGYEYGSFALRGGAQLGAATTVEASFWQTEGEVEYDGDFANRSEILQRSAGLSLRQGIGERFELTLSAGRGWDESDDYVEGAFMGSFDTTRDSLAAQLDYAVAERQLLTVGIDWLDDRVSGTTEYAVSSRDNLGVFAQYTGTFEALRLEASARHDDNEQFGDATTGSAGLAWMFSPAFELFAQYGTGFKAPTFNELYYPFFGNPLLEPERSGSTEFGAQGRAPGMNWRLSVFETRIRDLVGFDASFMPANVDRARIRGVEAQGSWQWQAWRFESAVTLLDTRNDTEGPEQGNELTRRPEASGHLDVERRFGALALGARLIAESDRWDDAANTRRINGYATLDLRAAYSFATHWRVQARAANVLDEQYETVAYFPQAGSSFYLELRYD